MSPLVQKILTQIGVVQNLKKHGMLSPDNAHFVLTDPEQTLQKMEQVNELAKSFYGPFTIPDRDVNGLIKFAHTQNSIPVGFNPQDCHTLIAGQTGCGKTSLIKILFAQILLLILWVSAPFRIWMFAKADDLRSLLRIHRNIAVIRFKQIKLNPLEPPPGIKSSDWAPIVIDAFIQAVRLYDGSKSYLIECLSLLYEAYEKQNHYPSFFDLYAFIKSQKHPGFSRTARYQESLLNRLGALLYGSCGNVFNCSRGHTNALTNMNVIFEVQYLSREQEVFMVNYLLSYLFHKKLANKTNIRHFVAIDDANSIFDASYEKRPDMGLPIIHHLLSTVRKSLINIFALTQTPHQIGASIISNAFALIMFSLSNGKDIEFMQQCMGIKEQEQKQHCYGIGQHEAVIKFANRYQSPFIAKIPEINFADLFIGDEFIIENNKRLLSGITIQPGFKPACSCSTKKGPESSTTDKPKSSSTCTLTERRAKDVLLDIYNRPFLTSTQRAKDLNLSAETSTSVNRHLGKNGYIETVRLNLTGKRGGLSTYHVITKSGYEFLEKKPPKQSGGTGVKHFFIQQYLKNELPNKGFTEVVVEKNLNNKRIDVFGVYEGLKIGIEVCCSTFKTEHENIQKDWDACDRIIVATPDKKTKEKVIKQLDGMTETKGKVKICMLSELLNNTDEIIMGTREQ
jgi:hypothetical protein